MQARKDNPVAQADLLETSSSKLENGAGRDTTTAIEEKNRSSFFHSLFFPVLHRFRSPNDGIFL